MNPGRELDALVAEKVMGWKHHVPSPDEATPKKWPTGVTSWYVESWVAPNGDSFNAIDLPLFSTDIAAAWEVVENLKDDWLMFLNWAPIRGFDVQLRSLCDDEETPDIGTGHSHSAPHAICLAALKAVGHE